MTNIDELINLVKAYKSGYIFSVKPNMNEVDRKKLIALEKYGFEIFNIYFRLTQDIRAQGAEGSYLK